MASACPGRSFPWPFDPAGLYYFLLHPRRAGDLMSANIAWSRFGRALVAIRDAEVAAEASGILQPRLLVAVFVLAGALGGIADAFPRCSPTSRPMPSPSRMSVPFFIGILIGGRGSILGPLLGTIIPDGPARVRRAAGAVVDLPLRRPPRHRAAIPGGIADPPTTRTAVRSSSTARSCRVPNCCAASWASTARRRSPRFGNRATSAACAPSTGWPGLEIHPRGTRPDRPQRQRQDHDANVISGYYRPNAGTMKLGGRQPAVRYAAPHAPITASPVPSRHRARSAAPRSW